MGSAPGTDIDVHRLLREVGLDGLAERDTGSLSGGELQRLALAAALARDPKLLIADEVTTMVDQQGRDALLGILSGLAKRHQTALVHITHYDNEAASADRVIKLSDSPDNTVAAETNAAAAPAVAVPHGSGCPCWSSSTSATNTPAAHRGPRSPCAMSASWWNRATGC